MSPSAEFKQKQNRAGQFYFVEPEKVEPTLRAGLADSNSIDHPYYRALHVFFVVNEVHPFKDGNGRAARLLQDKILLDHGYSGLFVTTLNRDFYLKTLRDTSLREDEGWARTYTENLMQIYRRNYDPPLRSEDQLIEHARRESDDSLDDESIQERIESIEEDPDNSDGPSP
ncbi:MAG: Fic family protein [bacterium]